METIVIDKYKKLILQEDCFIYLRTDVISKELKEQSFFYVKIKRVILTPKEYFWSRFWANFGLFVLFDGNLSNVDGERERIKLIFQDDTFRFIDCGNLETKEKQQIRNRIVIALNYWRQNNNVELL